MTGEKTAAATAATVSKLSSGFMTDPATYATGSDRGFGGLDFYFGGRAGVLGDVGADVVSAALVFFNPDTVRTSWDSAAAVMPRGEAATVFAGCAATWADAHLADDVDWARLAELAGAVVGAASPKAAPLFAGWRALPVPTAPKHAAAHHLNGLRELRMARHGAAVVACGLDPADAVRHNRPEMAFFFGWDTEVPVPAETPGRWDTAEAMTNQASAPDYAVLSPDEAATFVDLCIAATAAII